MAVNGALLDEAGPYYFVSYGDSSNAFARSSSFAEALDLRVRYDAEERVLVFTDGSRTVTFDATSDVRDGLVKRSGVVTISPPANGVAVLSSPSAILVDGTSYVPVTPLVTAFDGAAEWHEGRQLITIDTAEKLGYRLPPPRTGLTDGVSRVALDLPAGAPYEVDAEGNALLITLPGARADSATAPLDDPNLTSLTVTSGGGSVTVALRANYELGGGHGGYKYGTVDKGDTVTLYVDVSASFAPAGTPEGGPAAEEPAASKAAEEPIALTTVPERRQVVVIDAGHGGHDPGASSGYAIEKHVVLSVALKLKALLEAEGVEVILTRDDDTFLTLQERSLFSSSDRNLFVSVHANSAAAASAAGVETWVFGEPLEAGMLDRAIRENGGGAEGQALTEEARQAATSIAADILREAQLNYSRALAQTVQRNLVSATGAVDRGVRANLFYVIRNARIPAILVEIGFVSNPSEGARLATDDYQSTVAQALAKGVMEFLRDGGLTATAP